ncbi:transposase [Chitinophaga sancti]|uniref:Transposase DDE domain-containing protein n=1 Tax=Chitinophaga sancti TaxID=1004 RepID=A0A1K1SYM8_9BACT|nr:transposase [Chitinophaga sancti]WQD62309.1 hypothetical protein U0033_30925 [Chitinophaga sancti]WQG92122.1 hypothetical protein SR876_11460 [Chitinophaga sancti]SFW89480.1 hypothetical protein SAMN05661012_06439 [Chitinophaga sancti]
MAIGKTLSVVFKAHHQNQGVLLPPDLNEMIPDVLKEKPVSKEIMQKLNYQWLENRRITGYVKHNQFDRNQHKKTRNKKPYSSDKLRYDAAMDIYYCPKDKPMINAGTYTQKTSAGFEQAITRYETESCKWCRLLEQCHNSKGNRIIFFVESVKLDYLLA